MSVVIITHDLGVVAEHCNRIVIMYSAQVVESGYTRETIEQPRHLYTTGLLRSISNLSANRFAYRIKQVACHLYDEKGEKP